jgi:UPF0755 protein
MERMVKPTPEGGDERSEAAGGGRLFGRRGAMQSPTEALQPQAAPPPPVRRKRKRRGSILGAASGFLSFVLVLAVAATVVVGYGQ